jgi:hypothetical protein
VKDGIDRLNDTVTSILVHLESSDLENLEP